ncbi:MAG: single-stranded DNA-binding protein [Saprospiraceae bacterium]|nr:single-stranded DNA-binding protein [Saprospiraceae bacterium]MBP7642504.1 single-stranded DNA-binding protein [Saprospiraceae bacterium]
MKTMNNNVDLIGNLGQNVNLFTFDSGSKKANVSLATTSSFKNNKGEMQKQTQWHNLVAWGIQAEMMSKILSKGATVAVKGSLQYRTYEDKTGKEQRIAEVLVNEFLMMDKTKDSKEVTDKKVKKEAVPF